MSIAQKQLINAANATIVNYLQNGQVPTLNTVLSAIASMFKHGTPGTPFTNFQNFQHGTYVEPDVVNALTASIDLDLENLYQEGIDQVNRIIRAFDYKDSFRNRLTQRMIQISQEMAAIQVAPPYTISNVISSYQNVDLEKTTTAIDFETYSVTLPNVANVVDMVSLKDAKINYSVSNGHPNVISGVHHLANNIGNTSFLLRVEEHSKKACKCKVEIEFPNPKIFSHLDLDLQISGPTQIILDLDGEPQGTQSTDAISKVKWNFSVRSVKKIAIHLIKHEPDAIHGKKHYYDFGIKSVTAYYDEYKYKGVFQTLGLLFPTYLNQLTLTVAGMAPPNTKVEWSYSIGSKEQFVPIMPDIPTHQITALTPINRRVYPVKSANDPSRIFIVNPDFSRTKVDTDLSINSTRTGNLSTLFNLTRLEPSAINESVKVLRGYNSWYVQSYHYAVHDKQNNQPPTLKDLKNPRNKHATIKSRYQPTEFDVANQYPGNTLTNSQKMAIRLPAYEYPKNKPDDEVMHIFSARIVTSTAITSADLHTLSNLDITLPMALSNNKGAVYLNGKKRPIKVENNNGTLLAVVTLPFKFGTNYLNIVTNNYDSLNGSPFDFGTSVFTQYCTDGGLLSWYADSLAMQQVSLYELQYQTNRNDYTRFSVIDDTDTNKKILVTREMPTTVYNISYNNPANTKVLPVVLRAVITGDSTSPSVTPTITNFALVNSDPN